MADAAGRGRTPSPGTPHKGDGCSIYIYIYMRTYIYIYICIERERERERELLYLSKLIEQRGQPRRPFSRLPSAATPDLSTTCVACTRSGRRDATRRPCQPLQGPQLHLPAPAPPKMFTMKGAPTHRTDAPPACA